jgi:hypothetical protein
MEPEGSLPYSQEPAALPYPYFSKIRSNIVLPSMFRSYECVFPSDFATEILHTFLLAPMRAAYPAHLMLLDFATLIITFNIKIFCNEVWLCSMECH